MGLYVPESKLAFMPGFPTEPGPVGFISQSGGNAGEHADNALSKAKQTGKNQVCDYIPPSVGVA